MLKLFAIKMDTGFFLKDLQNILEGKDVQIVEKLKVILVENSPKKKF